MQEGTGEIQIAYRVPLPEDGSTHTLTLVSEFLTQSADIALNDPKLETDYALAEEPDTPNEKAAVDFVFLRFSFSRLQKRLRPQDGSEDHLR